MLGASVPLSGISFSAFVSKIYPLFGLAGILQLVGTIVYLAGYLTKMAPRKKIIKKKLNSTVFTFKIS